MPIETMTAMDETERALLRARLSLFAKWGFWLSLFMDVIDLAVRWRPPLQSVGSTLDRAETLVLLVMWLACRSPKRSYLALRLIDAIGCMVSAFAVTIMGRYLAHEIVPEILMSIGSEATTNVSPLEAHLIDAYSGMMIMLGGGIFFAFRAGVVPSRPSLTAFVTGVLGSPFVFVTALVAPVTGSGLTLRRPAPIGELITYGIWWAIVTATCVAISFVIYGLRREVRQAQRLGQYTLVEKLGEGGMGEVYRAQHARLRRPTAIKLLPPERLSEEAIARFEAEVQLTAELTHPNTITVFDYGRTDDGVFYYAMEYVEGATLSEIVELDGRQPPARVRRILGQIASALQEAHDVGLIHRDIKPSNVMLTRRGNDHDSVTVLDFGLARPIDRGGEAGVTREDGLVGTPHYMAPEVIADAERTSAASDLYALGAVGYFLLTGSEVFDAKTVVEVCAHHLHTEPVPPSKRVRGAEIPDALERLLLRCLAKEPADRPAGAAELGKALAAVDLGATWTDDDALRWWRDKGEALRGRRSIADPPERPTVTVVG